MGKIVHITDPDGVSAPAPLAVQIQPASTPEPFPAPAQQHRLSLRSPADILKLEFDPNDRYLDNGVFAKGQPLTLLGPGGIGKSRLLLHLAACTILGKPFLGMQVRAKGLCWLILQSENSNWRLQQDLRALKAWIGSDDWKHVESLLTLHTLEQPGDTRLSLADETVTKAISKLKADIRPDVIAFDPLGAFAVGNLNNDSGMQATCRAIDTLVTAGSNACSVVALHHTVTGKAGVAKATGYDRGSYGRGSKALNFWARGQINIAPAAEDNNDHLLVSCGKNSDGREFEPFGVRLNPETLIYEVDTEFSVEAWERNLKGSKAAKTKLAPETVAEFVKDAPKLKKDLVRAIMDETGCEKSTAYTAINDADAVTIRRNVEKLFEVIP